MSLPNDLERLLANFEAQLPGDDRGLPHGGRFLDGVRGEADVIEDQAGQDAAVVADRIAHMLAHHGRILRSFEIQKG